MKKIADLQFCGFVIMYQILKEKFKEYRTTIATSDGTDRKIKLESPTRVGTYIAIWDPDYHENEDELTEKDTIEIRISLPAPGGVDIYVLKSSLDDEKFINELKKFIGINVPAIQSAEEESKILDEIGEKIEKSPLSDFLVKSEQ